VPVPLAAVGLDEAIFELRLAGVTPVIAHPERIRHFQEDPARYEDVLRSASSADDVIQPARRLRFDRRAALEEMVRRGLVHILASDAHERRVSPAQARARAGALAETGR